MKDAVRDERLEALQHWLARLEPGLQIRPDTVRPASSDASFRRYFRVDAASAAGSFIAMDAPPQKEDCRPFLRAGSLIAGQGVATPQVIAADVDAGFLLLTDLGEVTYFDALQAGSADVEQLYSDALRALVQMQGLAGPGAAALPPYDRQRLRAELQLFPDWYVGRHLGIELDSRGTAVLEEAFSRILEAALCQAPVFVHRDFHSRNLMVLDGRARLHRADGAGPVLANPGVLDFQDAVRGPVTYDLVSLLRDAYVDWPEPRQIDWAARYWEMARAAGIAVPATFDVFWRDLEWMGLQRSLKILGIFSRLNYRDGKRRYLADLPLVLRQAEHVIHRYDALAPLGQLFERLHARKPQSGFSF